MRAIVQVAVLMVFLILLSSAAVSQEVFIYPAKGQSAEQQEQDKFECYKWAKEQTGFDPMKPPPDVAAAKPEESAAQRGGALKGAARGAAIGAVGGAIAGDAGKGAAAGAGVGALGGGMRQRQARQNQEKAQQAAEEAAKAEYAQARSAWERAAKTCLEGRGYTVN